MSYQSVCSIEIEFTGKSKTFKEYLLVSQESLPLIIPKLKRALVKCLKGHFYIQYLDDENDLVSVDSEEEFIEFFKLAKQRCSEEKLLKLVVKCDQIPDQLKLTSQPEFQEIAAIVHPVSSQQTMEHGLGPTLASNLAEQCSYFSQWKMDFKSELKAEILQELRNQLGAVEEPNILNNEVVANEEDSYGNLINISGKRKDKLIHNIKKLEKKEKLAESEIEQRLEKLEMKKKKLLEKASVRSLYRNPIMDAKIGLPFIMSGIATRDSVSLSKRVTVGKVFLHQWRIINDGTAPWKDVQLLNVWSSPGLEPDELILKCSPLLPGQQGQVTIKFRAPKVVGSFVTYWYFVYGPEMKQFGHYVSLTGNTKLPKQTCASAAQTKVQGCKKKSKDEIKKVNFSGEINLKSQAGKSTEEGFIYGNEKSLASAEIAAEMAREAAKALLRRATEMQTDDDLSKKCHEALNLVDSASDTDVNTNENEDTDPEFVIVNIPSMEATKATDKNVQTLIGDSANEKKETNVSQNLKVDGNIILPPQIQASGNDDINTNRVIEKETVVSKEVIENPQTGNSFLYPELSQFSQNSGSTFCQNPSSKLPDNPHQPLDLTNPVHVAFGCPLTHPQHPSHTFQVFPPQNSSSHAIAFPPPPTNYFPASQINSTLSYPPIKTYPPEMSTEKMPYQSIVFPPPVTYDFPMTVPTVVSPMPVSVVYEHISPMHQSNCEQFINKTNDQTPASQEGLDVFKNFGPQEEIQVISSNGLSAVTNQNVDASAENSNPQSPTETAITQATKGSSAGKKNEANATVQILPQSLVDGAITVATHAYSTAWNALNTFCPKEGETQTFDPVFENNMALMLEMGFRNMERNARLLKRYKNDINQVITVICTSPGVDNLEID